MFTARLRAMNHSAELKSIYSGPIPDGETTWRPKFLGIPCQKNARQKNVGAHWRVMLRQPMAQSR
ncbi:hypothetical protein PGA1_262p01150 (plasmid) [Phaeobacter inhibens DSM 17395]|nr:hypothetical protein PGA1_262p01150 [Phaeobacter inhibens DSM 17395]